MAITGYTPQGNGFVFQRDDGQNQFLFGPEANQLKAWIDQTRPPDQRLASNTNNGGFDPNAPLGSTASVPQAGPPTPPPSSSDGGMSGMSMAPPPPAPNASVQPPAPAQPPRPAPAPQQPAPQQSGPQLIQPPSGQLPPMQTGPADASSAEDAIPDLLKQQALLALTNKGLGGGPSKMVPFKQSIVGALPETPEEHDDRLKMEQTRRSVLDSSMAEINKVAAERTATSEQQQTYALNSAIKSDQDRRDALKRANDIEDSGNRKMAQLRTEADAAANQKIDPRRLFHGEGGTANSILSAIAVGLGAFGASMSGGPNYAQQIVNASIQRDVDSQTDDVHRRGAGAQNAISDFMQTYGLNLHEAKLAVQATAQRYAASVADMQASKMGSLDAREKAAQIKMQLVNDAAEKDAKLAEMYKGRLTTESHMAGGGSGSSLKNIKDTAETITAINKAFPNAKGKPGEVVPRLAPSEASVATAAGSLDHLQKLSDKAGSASMDQWLDTHGVGRKSELTSEAQNQAFAIARAEMGGNVPPEERVKQVFENLMSPSKQTRDQQIAAARELFANTHKANVDVSSRTAKVGTIASDNSGASE